MAHSGTGSMEGGAFSGIRDICTVQQRFPQGRAGLRA